MCPLTLTCSSKVLLSASADSTLYLAGGEYPEGSASREMWRYDPCFDSWIEMAPMNVARSELGEPVSSVMNLKGDIAEK